jgi:peptidoglycan/LPS O-acetylase OafA/YrhL
VLFVGTALLESLLTWIAGVDNVFSGMDFVMAVSLFMGVKTALFRKEPSGGVQRGISLIGSLTFGIYLLDPIIGNFLKPFVHRLYPSIPSYLGVSMLYCLVSMMVCGGLTFLYKKFVKRDI